MTNNERKIIKLTLILLFIGLISLNFYQWEQNLLLRRELEVGYFNEVIEPLLKCADRIEELTN